MNTITRLLSIFAVTVAAASSAQAQDRFFDAGDTGESVEACCDLKFEDCSVADATGCDPLDILSDCEQDADGTLHDCHGPLGQATADEGLDFDLDGDGFADPDVDGDGDLDVAFDDDDVDGRFGEVDDDSCGIADTAGDTFDDTDIVHVITDTRAAAGDWDGDGEVNSGDFGAVADDDTRKPSTGVETPSDIDSGKGPILADSIYESCCDPQGNCTLMIGGSCDPLDIASYCYEDDNTGNLYLCWSQNGL